MVRKAQRKIERERLTYAKVVQREEIDRLEVLADRYEKEGKIGMINSNAIRSVILRKMLNEFTS